MSRVILFVVCPLVALMLVLPLLVACGDDGGGGAKDEAPEIHVGMSALVTGPYGAYAPITWGYLDYIRNLNERGGIEGAEIVVHWRDCQYDVAQSLAAYTDYSKSHDLVAFTGMGTGANLALAPKCSEDGIVLVAIGGEPEIVCPVQDWVFGSTPNHAIGAVAAMQYVMEQWSEDRAPRVGIVYPPMAFGECIREPLKSFGEVLGYDVVTEQELSLTALDAVSQVLALKDADVDVVYAQLTAKAMGVLCKDMERQGFTPKMAVGPFHVIDPRFPELAGGAGEGVLAWNILRIWPQYLDNEAVQYWREKAVEYNTGDVESAENPYFAPLYMWGLSIGVTLEAGLREAAKEVGAENITAEAFRNGLEHVRDFSIDGITDFEPPVSFSPEDHEAYRTTSIMQVQNGEWVTVSDWFDSLWECEE